MSKTKKITLVVLLVFSATIITGWFSGLYSNSTNDIYAQVRKSILTFGEVYKTVTARYVEDIEPEKFLQAGIQGMLDKLDPYTVYLESEGKDEIEIMTRGKYYGVGMRIVVRNGWATVAEQPFANSPAFRAGIREGDQIVEIDGHSTKDESLTKTAGRLRGTEKGSEVKIKIKRVGEEKSLAFTLIRDEIVVSDIQYTGFVEPGVGLIKLERFNRGAGHQLFEAIQDLEEQGLDKLILDLRSNPGGLLDVAVEVADLFVPKGSLVVYTEGRHKDSRQEFRARTNPIFGEKPLVILVDGFSASASEIVSGAIQDLDRGVIIGSRSFGKGLVQTVVPLDRKGDTQLKLTTAKYYMPSGRLIQKPDAFNRGRGSVLMNSTENGDEDDPKEEEKEETVEEKFYTKNGRVVLGGGGITPDVKVKNPRTSRFVIELMRKSMFFNYSLNYAADHKNLTPDFEITDPILDGFFKFVEEKEFDYNPDGYEEIENIEKLAKEDGYLENIQASVDALKKDFKVVKQKEKENSIDDVKMLLKREISAKLFSADVAYQSMFASDSVLTKAVQILKDENEYSKLLNVQVAVKK